MAEPAAAAQFSRADLNPSDTQRFNTETKDELRRRIQDVDRQNQVHSGTLQNPYALCNTNKPPVLPHCSNKQTTPWIVVCCRLDLEPNNRQRHLHPACQRLGIHRQLRSRNTSLGLCLCHCAMHHGLLARAGLERPFLQHRLQWDPEEAFDTKEWWRQELCKALDLLRSWGCLS